MVQKKKIRTVTKPHEADVWPHERLAAQALTDAGYNVEFKVNNNREFTKSPDIVIGSRPWEIKSPTSNKLAAVERNLKKAYHQSENIVFDSLRMIKLPDSSIQRELIKQFRLTHNIRRLFFINKKREVIDIGRLAL